MKPYQVGSLAILCNFYVSRDVQFEIIMIPVFYVLHKIYRLDRVTNQLVYNSIQSTHSGAEGLKFLSTIYYFFVAATPP